MKQVTSNKDGHVEPLPYSIEEFARETGNDRRVVEKMVSSGQLKTVGANRRIPVSEACRIYQETYRRMIERVFSHKEEKRRQLALDLQYGRIKEVGVDDDGCVLYARTDVP